MLGVATSVLVPPMAFAVLAVIAFAFRRMWRRTASALCAIAVAGLIVLGLPYVSNSLMRSLEDRIDRSTPAEAPQAIIVLGGDQSRQYGPNGYDVGPLSLERLRTGARLAKQTGLPVLVTGGLLGRSPLSISEIMARSLRSDFGVDAKWLETRSGTTWENAEFSTAMLKAQGIHSAYVVTQGWHMPRAQEAFRHFGFPVVAAPTQVQPPTPLEWAYFIPSVHAWSDSYFALHEWIGWTFYALRR